VFVTDAGERPRIIKFDPRGRFLAATGEKGSEPGSLDLPHSLATDASGNVYVADSGNARIQVFDNSLNLRAVYDDIGTPWADTTKHCGVLISNPGKRRRRQHLTW
jgi:DNA-binding beta-propeller fold protein YncE